MTVILVEMDVTIALGVAHQCTKRLGRIPAARDGHQLLGAARVSRIPRGRPGIGEDKKEGSVLLGGRFGALAGDG